MEGNCDPLSIASMGVGIYHSRIKTDIELLYVSNGLEMNINEPNKLKKTQECISARAKAAIGPPCDKAPLGEGSDADLVIMGIDGKK